MFGTFKSLQGHHMLCKFKELTNAKVNRIIYKSCWERERERERESVNIKTSTVLQSVCGIESALFLV